MKIKIRRNEIWTACLYKNKKHLKNVKFFNLIVLLKTNKMKSTQVSFTVFNDDYQVILTDKALAKYLGHSNFGSLFLLSGNKNFSEILKKLK